MAKSGSSNKSQKASSKALRSSLIWPVLISVAIWLAGLLIYSIAPGRFDIAVSALIGVGLLIYLLHYQRSQRLNRVEQVVSVLLAIPAILGITAGMVLGQAVYAITGVSLSLLLLGLQRILTVPFSYRMARRKFMAGDTGMALDLADKSIRARPDFWETYQLRALIHLSALRFAPAERDAKRALLLRPDAHPALNTLGQLYLADNRFSDARHVYQQALAMIQTNPVYHYYLGLSEYRLERWRAAAEAFSDAIRGNLPYVTFELQAHYYFGKTLEILGETEKAEEVFAEMVKFKEGLPTLKEELASQPDFPHLELLQRDLRDLEAQLIAAGATEVGAG